MSNLIGDVMANSKDNKKRNWLLRLKLLKIRNKRTTSERMNGDANNLTRNDNNNNNRGGIRRSIMKVHSRIKRAFIKDENVNNENEVVTVAQNRVTLNSPIEHIENAYTTEPLRVVTISADNTAQSQTSQASYETMAPAVPPRRNNTNNVVPQSTWKVLKNEIADLWNYYWYWGPISGGQAEMRLKESPDGAFLVRDSTSDRYVFTMSFKNVGKILHTRIDVGKSGYSLFDQVEYDSVVELVEDAMAKSKSGVYCYTKTARDDIQPNFPVRLLLPVSRYEKVPSLKYLSRSVIRQYVNINIIDELPLPKSLLDYLQEDGRYF